MAHVDFDHDGSPNGAAVVLSLAPRAEPYVGRINGATVVVLAGAVFDPAVGHFAEHPYVAKAAIARGATGELVQYLQGVIVRRDGQQIDVDGRFGPATHAAVVTLQEQQSLSPDGMVGPKTWAVVDRLARGEERATQ